MVYCSSQLGVDLPPLEKKKIATVTQPHLYKWRENMRLYRARGPDATGAIR
jgi:hypothetical protein